MAVQPVKTAFYLSPLKVATTWFGLPAVLAGFSHLVFAQSHTNSGTKAVTSAYVNNGSPTVEASAISPPRMPNKALLNNATSTIKAESKILNWNVASKGSLNPKFAESERHSIHIEKRHLRPNQGSDLTTSAAPGSLNKTAESENVVVLCNSPVQEPLHNHLTSLGITILGVWPPNSYLASIDANRIQHVAGDSNVYAIVRLSAGDKLSEKIAARTQSKGLNDKSMMRIAVSLFKEDGNGKMAKDLALLGLHDFKYKSSIQCYIGICDAESINSIAEHPEVLYIESYEPSTLNLSTSVEHCNAIEIRNDPEEFGANVTIGIIDSGFQYVNHDAFQAQGGYPACFGLGWNVSGDGDNDDTWLDPNGHGTHVLGIIMSRWKNHTPDLDGVSPWLAGNSSHRFRAVRCGNNSGGTSLYNIDDAIDYITIDGESMVVNNSWGDGFDNTGNNPNSRMIDHAVWSKNQLWVAAAGNDGNVAGSIDTPGAAKNVLAVGNLRNTESLEVSTSSSMGPTLDGRFKPEIYAPGAAINSAHAADPSAPTLMSGTSMATPHVVGVAASLIDHFPDLARRPAALKAYMIATANRLPQIGDARAGLVDSLSSHWETDTSKSYFSWSDSSLTQGAETSWDISVPSGYNKMYIALTWIEPAPRVGSTYVVLSDIDLRVDRNADGSNEWNSSVRYDNLEFLEIDSPAGGTYRIKAFGYLISAGNRLGLGVSLRRAQAPVIEYFSHRIDDDTSTSSGNDDGVVNPGETIELPVTLKNTGTVDAHGVSAVLTTTDPYISVTDGNQSWGDIPSGSTDESVDFDFVVSQSCPNGRSVLFRLAIESDEGTWSDTFTIPVYTSGGAGPVISYHSHRIDDDMNVSQGNGDGLVNPGEEIELPLTLINTGSSDAHNVSALLGTRDPYVTITDGDRTWGTILSGDTDEASDFDFNVDPNCPAGHIITFELAIMSDEDAWASEFDIRVYGSPTVEISSFEIDDDSAGGSDGNGDGLVNPGESVEIPMTLINVGSLTTHGVSGILSCDDNYITVTDNDLRWGDIAAGVEDRASDFDISVDPSCPVDHIVNFVVHFSSDEESWQESFQITVVEAVNSPPTDISLSFSSVSENQPILSTVGILSTTDSDVEDAYTYSIAPGLGGEDNALFAVAANSLVTSRSLDFESKSICSVRLRSTDQGGLSFEKSFLISVLNLNDQPAFSLIYPVDSDNLRLRWSSYYSQNYSILWSDNLNQIFEPLESGIIATPPINERTVNVQGKERVYFKIEVE